MSRYSRRVPKESNSKISSSSNYKTTTSQQQTIPGTPIQQMWHILNFHETRLTNCHNFYKTKNQIVETQEKRVKTQVRLST